ncbi:hypothetical protein [Metalysinibacillus jejuensis]|uniref:hypothetical protein n=1 Tax=Metalysinibacillus jejuensis TaxID=914327 RepID=UPI000D3A4DDB|nr:hypothetical protein [Metalysinibacillus jejuensis]
MFNHQAYVKLANYRAPLFVFVALMLLVTGGVLINFVVPGAQFSWLFVVAALGFYFLLGALCSGLFIYNPLLVFVLTLVFHVAGLAWRLTLPGVTSAWYVLVLYSVVPPVVIWLSYHHQVKHRRNVMRAYLEGMR